MNNGELFALKSVMESMRSSGGNPFKLALMINEDLVSSRLTQLESLVAFSKEMEEYQKENKSLITVHAEKDTDGNIILYDGQGGNGKIITETGSGIPHITIDVDVYDKENKELLEKYKTALAEHQVKIDAYIETLNEPVTDLTFTTFNMDSLPELDYDQLRALKPLIEF